jgi:hypothetical protein
MLPDTAVSCRNGFRRRDRHAARSSQEPDMTSSSIDIPEVAAMVTADIPVGAPGGGQGSVLGGLAGVSPVLAAAYLGYLVVRMLIPAVLIVATIGGVPAGQRSALLRAYLRAPADQPQQLAIEHLIAATDNPATAAPALAGGDHVPEAGDNE